MPICKAAAVKFADMHDTTARMLAKGAIHVSIEHNTYMLYLQLTIYIQINEWYYVHRTRYLGVVHVTTSTTC
jgi:hypothetical protein